MKHLSLSLLVATLLAATVAADPPRPVDFAAVADMQHGGSGPVICTTYSYLYVAAWSPAEIFRYCVEPTGGLTFMDVIHTEADARDLVVDTRRSRLYYAAIGITVFDIQPDGTLAPLGTVPVGNGNFDDIELDPAGDFLYGTHSSNSVRVFELVDEGLPFPVQTIPGLSSPRGLLVDRNRTRLHVANNLTFFGEHPNQEEILSYDRNGLGTLDNPASTGWFAKAAYFAMHPSGDFLFFTQESFGTVGTAAVTVGGLQPPAFAPAYSGIGPTQPALDATGTHLYVTNEISLDVSVFNVDQATGELELAQTIATPPHPEDIVLHPDLPFAYVVSAFTGTSSISVFSVAADGTLALADSVPVPCDGADRLALVNLKPGPATLPQPTAADVPSSPSHGPSVDLGH